MLLEDVNDGEEDARSLARYARRFPSSVNLIPYNAVPEFPHRAPPRERVRRFAEILRDAGVRTTVRLRRGADAAAACGQLRVEQAAGKGK